MNSGTSGPEKIKPQSDPSPGELNQRAAKARHDLRNPLSHILGFSEMLLDEARTHGHEQLKPDLELLYRTADRMIALTNHYLDWHKIEAGLSDIPILEDQLRQLSTLVLVTTEHLVNQSGVLHSEILRNDLARITGAARQMLGLIEPALRSLSVTALHPDRPEAAGSSITDFLERRLAEARPVIHSRKEGNVLVVDDLEDNRVLLLRLLSRLGYSVQLMDSGRNALNYVAGHPVDLILLDIMMPELDGVETLKRLKANPTMAHIPVIMLSFADEVGTVVRCIELGAEDFLPKPFNMVLLMARIESCLAKKRLRDQEQAFVKRLQEEQEISERLLLNILPRPIAERLKQGEKIIADSFPEATVLFTDFVGFTHLAAGVPAVELVGRLSDIFSAFDRLCDRHGLEKIKTIGDAYMVVGGLPTPRPDHAEAVAGIALEMQQEVARFTPRSGQSLRMRIGIHTGPVIAGVIGAKKFAYDLWGETVNLAKHMEAHAPTGGILTTAATYERLKGKFTLQKAQSVTVKGEIEVLTYLLLAKA